MHDSMKRLSTGLAHDTNNVIASIKGFAEIAASLLDDAPPMLSRSIKNILKGCDQAEQHVAQVRLMSGWADVTKVLLPLHSLLRLWSAEAGLGDSAVLDFSETDTAWADENLLKQAILAVLDNARWATEQGGTVELGVEKHNRATHIIINDTGCGMSQEVLEQSMMPYFTTRAETGHKGKGLALALGVVEAHGGTVQVFSEQGKGSRVVIMLPAEMPK